MANRLRRALPALVTVPFFEPVISTVRQLADLPAKDPAVAYAGGSWPRVTLGHLLGMDTTAA